jgi:hypothetical protein
MNQTISLLADICGILAFFISLYAATGVYKINKRNNSNKVSVKGTTIGGDFTGRDKS